VPETSTLVIQTAHLGDVVLTLPLLARLAQVHGPVDVVTTPAAIDIVRRQPSVRQAISFDKSSRIGAGGVLRLGRGLRRARYHQIYLPHGSVRSAIVARLTGAGERVGFAGSPGAFLYSRRVAEPARGHRSRRLLALAPPGPDPAVPWLELPAESRIKAAAWLEQSAIPPGFVVLAPGARWATKRWPYFPELASRLSCPLVVVGGPEDVDRGQAILRSARGPAGNAAGAFTIVETAALIERSALLVTNDSLSLHLASALGRPVVALFGPTAPGFGFGPTGPEDEVVEHDTLGCRPCSVHGPRVCPLGHHRCLGDLAVTWVLEAVERRVAPQGGADRSAVGVPAEWR